MKLYQILLLLVCLFVLPSWVLAAPDPAVVKERKQEAHLHVSGKVIDDSLVEEFKEDQTQSRKMIIKIEEIYQQTITPPESVQELIEVQYLYVPDWIDYTGKSVHVRTGDIVELWLEKDGQFLTPTIGGYGVEMLQSSGPRVEHIPEPFTHKVKSIWHEAWSNSFSPFTVFIVLVLILFILLWYGSKNWKKH
ncbi:hypothetical protein [Robertmurraya kyonggiensis]|uniref:Uncharacterized protein n=1 Tax=Robertmurraya kyonggiensis TaxID=1037680 RepID=A0A4V5P0R0_9BACI|nr:hypothetical protein [Robertmurraya kyonggiensis]TKC15470.1 hypothetical protein FA727_18790 [Robertmurraya kyonggiensis]